VCPYCKLLVLEGDESLFADAIKIALAIAIVLAAIIGKVFMFSEWLEKHPNIKKVAESGITYAVLLIVAIVLLAGVFQDINAVREALNVRPAAPKAPPAPIVVKEEPPARSSPGPKPSPTFSAEINNAPNGIAIGGGTVTNPTVNNFGTPSRRLTSQQISAIKSSAQGLCSTLPPIAVTAANANQEAQRYALDFFNALKGGGCNADLALPIPGLMPNVIGLYVGVRDTRNLEPTAEALKQILSKTEIPYSVAPMKPDFFSDKQTVLVVGASE
jgi:hypothetical protein